jgi:hypothetical protein
MIHAPKVVCAALILLAATACHSGGSTPSSANTPDPADTANVDAAKAQITENWQAFFASGTSTKDAAALLQDGSSLSRALKTMARVDLQAGLDRTAVVNSIVFTGPATAKVRWDQDNGATKLLANAKGKAVVVNGHWVVSKKTFCAVVTAANNQVAPHGCPTVALPSTSTSTSPSPLS